MVREACRDEKSGMRIPASDVLPPYYSDQGGVVGGQKRGVKNAGYFAM